MEYEASPRNFQAADEPTFSKAAGMDKEAWLHHVAAYQAQRRNGS